MNLRSWSAKSMALALFLGLCTRSIYSAPRSHLARLNQLVMSRAEYLDRVHAIWTAQMIGQWTGLQFEHRVASVLTNTPLRPSKG
ncbi:MAG TPA: hypothetical protein VGM27_17185 [Acidobacteriaceae bacterium]